MILVYFPSDEYVDDVVNNRTIIEQIHFMNSMEQECVEL